MPRPRSLLHWPYLLTTLAAGIAPLAIFLVVSYLQALHRAEAFLTDIVDIAAERAEGLLSEAELKLTRFVEVTRGEPSPESERLLRQLVYTDPQFREAGIIDERGRLVFSTAAPIDEPIPIPADQRVDPTVAGFQVVGLLKTSVMREESVVLGLPTPAGGEVDLLVDPAVLRLFLDDVELGPDGYLAFVGPSDVMVVIGSAERALDHDPAEGGIRVTREFGEDRIVAGVGQAWALEDWSANLHFSVPVAALCSAILMVIVIRLINGRTGLDHDLRLGLRRDEFQVEYQPIIDLDTGRCVAAEALLRWHHPSHGYVGPDTFIPIAEETGLIEPLTEWLLARVADEQAGLLRRHPDLRISVNCPAPLLSTRALETALQRFPTRLAADRLVFELTERVLIENEDRAREAMSGLRNAGYRFALDDFGAGYSGLGHLHRFEFEYVKIDRSFVHAIEDPVSAAILDSLLEVAAKLGATTVAEGVETEAQLRHLKARRVRFAQGWLLSTSLGVGALEQFLGRSAATAPAG